jgi:TonB family protein
MIYLLQYTLYTMLLYALYHILLRNHATHAWNRGYLLLCAMLPIVLPMIQLPGLANTLPSTIGAIANLPGVTISAWGGSQQDANGIYEILAAAYVVVAVVLFMLPGIQLFRMWRRISRLAPAQFENGVRIVTNSGMGPGSFGNLIFFPGDTISDAILAHERAHVRLRHSIDVVLMRILQCVFWPNFMLYVIARELRTVHEFEADSRACTSRQEYMQAMLNTAFNTRNFSLTHTFFHHPIKRRIVMLQQTQQSRSMLRTITIRSGIATALLTATVICSQSCTQNPAAPAAAAAAAASEKKVLKTAEQMPQPTFDLPDFLGKNIVYPQVAKEKKIEGKVVVRFVVDDEGNVKDPFIVKSPDTLLSAEVLRVVKLMPKWKPGMQGNEAVCVLAAVPVSFKLD